MESGQPISGGKSKSVSPEAMQGIIRKLQGLPPQYIPEVALFIDYLRHRLEKDGAKETEAFFRLSAEVWDND